MIARFATDDGEFKSHSLGLKNYLDWRFYYPNCVGPCLVEHGQGLNSQ